MDHFVVRHAKAGSRSRYVGPDDRLRPLSKGGRRQAAALADLLGHRPITRVLSSPYLRCIETVTPLAEQLDLPVELDDRLEEGRGAAAALELLTGTTRPLALCSHGDVIAELVQQVASSGASIDDDRLAKGSTWVLRVDDGRVVKGRYLPPPA